MSNHEVRCFGRREADVDFATVGRLPGRIVRLSVDEDLACARTESKDVYWWGIDAFRMDLNHACAAASDGHVYCWGKLNDMLHPHVATPP